VPTPGLQVEYELKAEARLDAKSVSPVEMKELVGRQVQVSMAFRGAPSGRELNGQDIANQVVNCTSDMS
jgi:hypothetical protein